MKIKKEKLIDFLDQEQITQAQLASAAAISRKTLSYIMYGKNCKPVVAGKIAKALGVDVAEIIETEN